MVFVKVTVPGALVLPPGATFAIPVETLLLVKSSLLVLLTAPGWPCGPVRTSAWTIGVVVLKGDVALIRVPIELLAEAVPCSVIELVASVVVIVTTMLVLAPHAPTPSELPTLYATIVTPAGCAVVQTAAVTGSLATDEVEKSVPAGNACAASVV